MDERRERDPDTGENVFVQTEAGASDMFAKIAAKITGKTAKKLAAKAMTKGMEKIGEKTGTLIGEKIFLSVLHKNSQKDNNYQYIDLPIHQTNTPKVESLPKQQRNTPKDNKYQYIKDVYNGRL